VDPVSLAIITALGNLSQEVIKDSYVAFKAAIQKKYGVKSELLESVEKLEEKPDSKARQSVVQEEIANVKADQDLDLVQTANVLLEKLKAFPGANVNIKQDINVKGSGNIIIGQGDATVNK